MIAIVASTRQQAKVVADDLNHAPTEWRFVCMPGDLQGVSAADIVIAWPTLEGANRIHWDILAEVERIEYRDGVKAKTIWT